MKKTVLSLTLLAATLFLAAARADVKAPAAAPALSADDLALLKRYDRNGDGQLDEDELAAAHEALLKASFSGGAAGVKGGRQRAALIRRFDQNGDGKLDAAEWAEAKRVILARYDTNHDGRLDEDERAAMRADFKARAQALKLKN
jgi:hypothetical protein